MIKKYALPGLVALGMVATSEAGLLESWSSYMWKTEQPKPPSVKVLVVKSKPGVVLEVKGKYKLYDPNTMEHISTRFVGKRRYMQALSDGLRWGEQFPGIYQLLIVPDENGTTTLIDGVEYSGSLYVYDVGGKISVVNDVYVEDYIDSLLTGSGSGLMPEEALGAMAIVDRTQAYYAANNPKTAFWALDGAKVGYEGHPNLPKSPRVENTLGTTKYMVLTEGDKPFNANWDNASITLDEAQRLGAQGENAAQILKRAFPSAQLKVMLSNTQ
ncbi:MAG: hypothetical protein KDK62_06765 [Chlamydiia bacterium]|nr:hypothetical protein [Chlamydiia bacterium]